jgi:hypothetical protein
MKTNNIKLLLTGTAFAVFGALSIQACSSSDDSSSSSGGSSGSGGTTSTAGKGGSGTAGSTSTAGKGGSGTGGSGTAGSGTAGSGTAGSTTVGGASEGGATGDMGGASEGGASGGDHPSLAECTAFCTMEGTVCGFGPADLGMADDHPYASSEACMTDCAAFALGDDSDPTHHTPESGDSFACRAYHLYNASLPNNKAVHCPHTSNISHNMDGSTTGAPCVP